MLRETLRARCKGCGYDITIHGNNPKHELIARVEASFIVSKADEILSDKSEYLDLIWDPVQDKLNDNLNIKLICPVCGEEYLLDEYTDMTKEDRCTL